MGLVCKSCPKVFDFTEEMLAHLLFFLLNGFYIIVYLFSYYYFIVLDTIIKAISEP
jgi:hypothetical protein